MQKSSNANVYWWSTATDNRINILCDQVSLSSVIYREKMSSQPHTAIVTGAANGIGRAIALQLASDGFNVAICDISSQEDALKALKIEIEAKGREALTMVANVTVEKEVNDFVSTVVSRFGGLDVVRKLSYDIHNNELTPQQDGCKCGCGCPHTDPWKQVQFLLPTIYDFTIVQQPWKNGISCSTRMSRVLFCATKLQPEWWLSKTVEVESLVSFELRSKMMLHWES